MKKKYILLGIVIIIVLAIGVLYVYFENQRIVNYQKAVTASETSGAEYIKSSIEVYYALYGKYPYSTDDLIESLSTDEYIKSRPKDKQFDTPFLQKTIKELKNFSYSVRGDRQAYKITYMDQYGEKKELQGEYKKEFH